MKEWDKFLLSVKSTLEEAGKPASLALWALLSADLPAIRPTISHSALCFERGGGVGMEGGRGGLGTAKVAA